MKLTILTCTGDRPVAFSRCEQYVARQTRKPDEWIVVDDGETPTVCTMGQTYLRRKPGLADPLHTLVPNLRLGLRHVTGDALAFVEDDDWYAPGWLAWASEKLATLDMVGEGFFTYYNVEWRKTITHYNMDHAALCATVLRREMFADFRKLLDDPDPFVDRRLWSSCRGKWRCGMRSINVHPKLVVGIKGMPGRRGQGFGHIPRWEGWEDDAGGAALRQLIGDDAAFYAPFWKGEYCVSAAQPLAISY